MELDDAYANGKYIEGGAAYPDRWNAAAAQFRAQMAEAGRARLNQPYDSGPRHGFDLFLPEGTPSGVLVFVHGGYWLNFDRSTWSHFAAGGLGRGWAVALPSYDLCPQVRIADITSQIAKAVQAVAAAVPGPIALTGHSAGGHLVARMLAPGMLSADVAGRIRHVVPISPLSDLRPLLKTTMNDSFAMTEADAAAESPVRQPAPATAVTVWVGGDERPAFLDQARWLAEAWNAPNVVVPGKHHFNVIDDLADPDSDLTRTLAGA